jgi:hypothetical protein
MAASCCDDNVWDISEPEEASLAVSAEEVVGLSDNPWDDDENEDPIPSPDPGCLEPVSKKCRIGELSGELESPVASIQGESDEDVPNECGFLTRVSKPLGPPMAQPVSRAGLSWWTDILWQATEHLRLGLPAACFYEPTHEEYCAGTCGVRFGFEASVGIETAKGRYCQSCLKAAYIFVALVEITYSILTRTDNLAIHDAFVCVCWSNGRWRYALALPSHSTEEGGSKVIKPGSPNPKMSCSADCTENQPGNLVRKPFRDTKQFRPDCLQAPHGH